MRTIIDVVLVKVRVSRIVHYERSAKTVTVLRGEMAVIPEGTCIIIIKMLVLSNNRKLGHTSLVGHLEVVQERVTRRNGALIDKCRSISPVCTVLEEAMPVLPKTINSE